MNMIAEGYYATELVYELATNNNIDMPIVKAVYDVVYKQGDAKKIFNFLAEKQLC
jgi:glycerol-3-phosphate dehydrogenase (NAD(P)+)